MRGPGCSLTYFFMLSLDIPSLDILSFFIASLALVSFDIVSFFMPSSFFMVSDLVMPSFFMSSAKAPGANASAKPNVAAARDRTVRERVIAYSS